MKKNVGLVDRVLRVLLAVIVLALYLAGKLTGTSAVILGVVAVILLLTSLFSFCPIYWVSKLSTHKK